MHTGEGACKLCAILGCSADKGTTDYAVACMHHSGVFLCMQVDSFCAELVQCWVALLLQFAVCCLYAEGASRVHVLCALGH